MITGHVFIATSLDGYIARSGGELDWLMKQETDGEDHGYDAFMASVDGIVMGRRSFEAVLYFDEWPYEKPVVVMSRTLGRNDVPTPIADRVTLTRLDPAGVMKMLGGQGWRRAYIDGGKVVQSFLRDGLIADMTLTRIPVLIGGGHPLFGALDRDVECEHQETLTYPSGLVTSRYRVVHAAGG